MESVALDEERAALLADVEPAPFTQRFSEWTPEAELLASCVEVLQKIAALLHKASFMGEPDPIVSWPRPVAAIDAARRAVRWDKHHALVRRLSPDR